MAILGFRTGRVIEPTGPFLHRYTIGGPLAELLFAALLAHLASTANRIRKHLLRRPRSPT